MANIHIVQKNLTKYRIPFLNRLREELSADGVKLNLIYSPPSKDYKKRGIDEELGWGEVVPIYECGRLYWQHLFSKLSDSDLVITFNHLTAVSSVLYLMLSKVCGSKFAFWDHGRDMDEYKRFSAKEPVRDFISTRANWWFGYTDMSRRILEEIGFPGNKITIVNNAKKTYQYEIEHVGHFEWVNPEEDNVGMFIGQLTDNTKEIALLMKLALSIKDKIPNFKLLIIGDGPDSDIVQEYDAEHNWIFWEGAKFKEEALPYFKSADLILNPGDIGLVTIDSFAYEVPIVTMKRNSHRPEVEYLTPENSLMVPENDTEAFVEGVRSLFHSKKRLEELRIGCQRSHQKYNLSNMVYNFHAGVLKALSV